jgi:DHA1 family multidrug resistance protein-like MFS transporter
LLADRFGRKIMVERAMFAGAVIFLCMGFAQTVQQLMALRVLQGLLTGTITAATALVASTTPPEHAGYSLGILQTGIYLGASAGPLVGGVIADSLGYRPTFWITAFLVLIAGLAVHFAVREDFQRPVDVGGRMDRHWWDGLVRVLASPELRLILLINMLVRVAARSLSPMLPLFVAEIAPDSDHLAATAGLVAGVGAVSGAAGASLLGRASDRAGPRKVLAWCIFGSALAVAGQAFVVIVGQLAALQAVAGFLTAGVLASVSVLLARSVRGGRHGAAFGVNSTSIAAASAVGPLVAATVAVSWGLRSVFLTSALILGMAGLLVIWAFFMPGLKGSRSTEVEGEGVEHA